MSENAPLPPEILAALTRYLEVQKEEKRLEEEKGRLRDVLVAHMQSLRRERLLPEVGGKPISVKYVVKRDVKYDEAKLQQRLGDRYASILSPDPGKIRRHLGEVAHLLVPVLPLVGTPDPERVRAAIESGSVTKAEFAGAFEKTERHVIAVSSAPREPSPGGAASGSEARQPGP